jgi:hypothetical protein
MNIFKIIESLNRSATEKDYAQVEVYIKELLGRGVVLNQIQFKDHFNSRFLSKELKDLITLREKLKAEIYQHADVEDYDKCAELRGNQRKIDRIIQADMFTEIYGEKENLFHIVSEKEIIYRLPLDQNDAMALVSAIRRHFSYDGKPCVTQNRLERIREQLNQRK